MAYCIGALACDRAQRVVGGGLFSSERSLREVLLHTWVGGTTLVSPCRSGFVTGFKSGSQCLCERGYGGITVCSWWPLHPRLVRTYVCMPYWQQTEYTKDKRSQMGGWWGTGVLIAFIIIPSPPLPSPPLLFLPLQFYWLQWNICAASRTHQGKVVLQRTVSTTLQRSYFICDSVTSLQVVSPLLPLQKSYFICDSVTSLPVVSPLLPLQKSNFICDSVTSLQVVSPLLPLQKSYFICDSVTSLQVVITIVAMYYLLCLYCVACSYAITVRAIWC